MQGVFLLAFGLQALILGVYNGAVDVPMYLRRYAADQAAGKTYFPFWEGLVDAASRRIPTHALADWHADMLWMVGYFALNPLMSIAVAAAAPTTGPNAAARAKRNTHGTPRYKHGESLIRA
jgi:hypothetical protein